MVIAVHLSNYRVKANAHYICQECGSTEMIQAHHQIPKDDSTLICLCAECHSKRHPDIPRALFFNKNTQPYWENKSASTIAKEVGLNPRTICRRAKRLGISKGILSEADEILLKKRHEKVQYIPHPRIKKVKEKKVPLIMPIEPILRLMNTNYLTCRRCKGSTKHWKIGNRLSTRNGKRTRYFCSVCGTTRYQ